MCVCMNACVPSFLAIMQIIKIVLQQLQYLQALCSNEEHTLNCNPVYIHIYIYIYIYNIIIMHYS